MGMRETADTDAELERLARTQMSKSVDASFEQAYAAVLGTPEGARLYAARGLLGKSRAALAATRAREQLSRTMSSAGRLRKGSTPLLEAEGVAEFLQTPEGQSLYENYRRLDP
jgi:hypothetical protein